MSRILLFLLLFLSSAGFVTSQSGFVDVTSSSGVQHRGYNAMQMGGGSAWFDYDGDGDEDLIAVGGTGDNKLYRNDGAGSFTDVTVAAGLGNITWDTQGVVTGDVDNDGFREIFISTMWHQPNLFFQNNGDGTFTDASVSSGIGLDSMWVSSAAFGDYDRDGLLDLYRGNYVWLGQAITDSSGQPIGYAHRCNGNSLFHNNGNGTFTDIGAQEMVNDTGCALSVVFTDYDLDNDPDILVANDFGMWVAPNGLYQNNYPGPYADVGASTYADQAMYGMGIAVGDYDHDLDLDYYITDIGAAALYQQQPNHTFFQMATQAGIEDDSIGNAMATGWGNAWIDFDNDKWQDMFIAHGYIQLIPIFANVIQDPDKMYRNLGNGTFSDVTLALNLGDTNAGRGMAMADFDKDGDLDMFVNVVNLSLGGNDVSRLYSNDYSGSNHWLQVEPRGTYSNRDAFGAKMIVKVGADKWIHEVNGGSSHMSQHTHIAHFGMGTDTIVDSLWVIWPNGGVQLLTQIAGDQRILVIEDSAGFLAVPKPEITDLQVYPNPFDASLHVDFSLASGRNVVLSITDMTGRIVWESGLKGIPGVPLRWTWDGRTNAGLETPAGMYCLRVQVGAEQQVVRVMRAR
ncbi:MAG: VCBS repeat-containing protein [Bacteroidetes bacterium]|nr:VCBS repeat-containing protein [Bacteroidota bacterium]